MLRSLWLRKLSSALFGRPSSSRKLRRHLRRTRLNLEPLEDRTLLSGGLPYPTPSTVSQLTADVVYANSNAGSYTITLQAGAPFDFTAADNNTNGANALPVITGNITIVGNGDTIDRSTASGTPVFRLFDVASGGSLTIENATLMGGLAYGSGAAAEGGAIYSSGMLTLSGVTLKSNTAQGSNGHGFHGSKGFDGGNGASASGGGLYVAGGGVTLSNDTLSNNYARGGNGGNGFSYYIGPGGTGGTGASAYGGGLYMAGGTVTLNKDTLSNNYASGGNGGNGANILAGSGGGNGGNGNTGGSASGGGLYAAGGTVALSNDTLSNNYASGGNGGIGGNGGGEFGGSGGNGSNGASAAGGGLYEAGDTVTLNNDTLSNNHAQGGNGGNGGNGARGVTGHGHTGGNGGNGGSFSGGGLYVAGGTATLNNDTLSSNQINGGTGGNGGKAGSGFGARSGSGGGGGAGSGGGSYVGSGSVTLHNTLISGNSGGDVSGTLDNASDYNLIGDGSGGLSTSKHNLLGISALLAPLGNYGGPTQTMALLPGSPAIDAGSSAYGGSTDQRGESRFGATDIGAFESQGFSIALSSGNNQFAVVNTAFAQPLVALVTANNAVEPVTGGLVTFTAPASGASAVFSGNPATIGSDGKASVTATANGTTGSYTVNAIATGIASPASFSLTNVSSTVTSTADDGSAGTLRYVINLANTLGGVITEIDFHIGTVGSSQTISLTSPLPALTDNGVFINGLSQGGSGNTKQLITLDGTNAGSSSDGLLLQGSNCIVSGLLVEHFNNGIEVAASNNTIGGSTTGARNIISGNTSDGVLLDSSATGVTVQGNYIGLDKSGKAVLANGTNGIEVQGNKNTIGGNSGSNYYTRNFISGNGNDGVLIDSGATGNQVLGNFIGIDISGTKGAANAANGIEIGGNNDTIGGTISGVGNVISGNSNDGVLLDGSVSGSLVQGNDIGTDYTGNNAVANSGNGIEVMGVSFENLLGGSTSGARNIISGNSKDGVLLDPQAQSNLIQGNYIGINLSSAALGNANGIDIFGGSSNIIGGTVSAARNILSGNSNDGLLLDEDAYDQVLGNYIGTSSDGTLARRNKVGIEISGYGNTIGGSVSGSRNIISGNSADGLLIDNALEAAANQVLGNYVGLNVHGSALGNSGNGIEIGFASYFNFPGNTIGGVASGSRNIISGNGNDGVLLDSTASGNQVLGNYIGTNISGNAAVANGNNGIEVAGSLNTLGSTNSAANNVISGNSNDGVLLDSGAGSNQVLGNFIGTDFTGLTAVANKVGIEDAGNNTLGGSVLGARNIISGNSGDGVLLDSTASGETVQGNFMGLNKQGTAALANGSNGIEIQGTNNTIGGNSHSNYFTRNFLTGNGNDGVLIDSGGSGNQVLGNFIGVDISGTNGLGNVGNGVEIAGSNNTVGGSISGLGNTISGSSKDGVLLGNTATGNLVQGNDIGTDYTGRSALGNSSNGIEVIGVNNTLGGTTAGAGNVIASNSNNGVQIDSGASGTAVQGNYIGTNAAGGSLGNGANGVSIASNDNTIGGNAYRAANTIANNSGDGVLVNGDVGNSLLRNSILGNTGLGISLTNGSNDGVDAPSITSASYSGGTLTVDVTYGAFIARPSYAIELFASPGSDEGAVYLGTITLTPKSTGTQSFLYSTTTTVVTSNPIITATLTDSLGDTSEFSTGVTV